MLSETSPPEALRNGRLILGKLHACALLNGNCITAPKNVEQFGRFRMKHYDTTYASISEEFYYKTKDLF